MNPSPRALYFGELGEFSATPLEALLRAGVPVCGIVATRNPPAAGAPPRLLNSSAAASRPGPPLPVLDTDARTIARLARDHCIPLLEVAGLRDPEVQAQLERFRPDLILVACCRWILPPAVLSLPRLGCLNLHPSLLPAHRGPAPLFWTFRRGESVTGITVHWMNERVDAGDLVYQERIEVPEGIGGRELERRCAEQGGALFLEAAEAAAAANAPRRPQDESRATYESWPHAEDFEVSPRWPARRVFSFVRGVCDWGKPFVVLEGQAIPIRSAAGYSDSESPDRAFRRDGADLWIRCSPGVAHLLL